MVAPTPKTVINAIALLVAHDLSEGVEEVAVGGATPEGGPIEGTVSVLRVEAR